MDIETQLDDAGRGTLSRGMFDFFEAAGCTPACHICNNHIEPGTEFRLKEYVKPSRRVRKDGTEISAKIMICGSCDKKNKKLPRHQTSAVLREGMERADLDWRLIRTEYRRTSSNVSTNYHYRYSGCFVINGKVVSND